MKRIWTLGVMLFLLSLGVYTTIPYQKMELHPHLPTYPPYLDSVALYGTASVCTVGQNWITVTSTGKANAYTCVLSVGTKEYVK